MVQKSCKMRAPVRVEVCDSGALEGQVDLTHVMRHFTDRFDCPVTTEDPRGNRFTINFAVRRALGPEALSTFHEAVEAEGMDVMGRKVGFKVLDVLEDDSAQ